MSQRSVEYVLGRLVTDEGFRDRFFKDPLTATVVIGATLSAREVDALKRVPRSMLSDLADRLDGRICRLHLGSTETIPEYQS
jgi:hypothetical protein